MYKKLHEESEEMSLFYIAKHLNIFTIESYRY